MRATAARRDVDEYGADWPGLARAFLSACLRPVRERPVDSIACIVAAFVTVVILINALYMQSGPHPAPIFANRLPPASVAAAAPSSARPAPANPRVRAEVVSEIQRELTRRGFYEGAADGVYGPKTDAAIRDFEHAAGLRPSTEPNETLLQSIVRSSIRTTPAAPSRSDPIADLLAPNWRVMAVQRALAHYGYGQIKPTGHFTPETKAAIEEFERKHKLPITGKISDRLTRELTAMTGRPLE